MIPAEKFLFTLISDEVNYEEWKKNIPVIVYTAMIEFAKRHVTEALEAVINNAEVEEHYPNPYDPESKIYIINEKSILNAYDLNQIK